MRSASRVTAVSPCPTPAVSSSSRVIPAAAISRSAPGTSGASPPAPVRAAMLRKKIPGRGVRRTRSPSSAPPLRGLVGSTASTPVPPAAPRSANAPASAPASSLFPTPGGPVSATTRAADGHPSPAAATAASSSPDSSRVMARASAARSPSRSRASSEANSPARGESAATVADDPEATRSRR